MAEDRKDKPMTDGKTPGDTPPSASAIPNRDRRREPPVIDARPGEVTEVSTPATGPAASASAAPKDGPKPAGDPAATVGASAAVSADAAAKSASSDTPKPEASPIRAPAGAKPTPSSAGQTAPPPAPARRSGGLLAGLLAGIAGAAVALAGGYALVAPKFYSAQQVDALLASAAGKSTADQNSALTAALAAAQKRAGDDFAKQAAAVDEIGKRVAAMEALSKKLLGDVEAVRAVAAKPPASAPSAPAVDLAPIEAGLGDLEKRIAEIEKALSAPKTPARASDPDVKPPEGPATTAPAAPNIPAPALMADLSALAERLRALETRPAPRVPDIAQSLAPLQTRLQQLEQRLAPLAEKLGPMEAALAQGRETSGAQAKSIEAQRERADAAALAVVGRGVADAVLSGVPFGNLLKAAQALGADANAVKALTPFADKGVPPAASLVAQFAPIATALIDGDAQPDPKASLTEKLAASAGKLVRVRPADDTTEETPAALATRINVALRAQKFDEALALYGKLPEPARLRAKTWADAVRAHLDAVRASETIVNAALARLARP